mmetsp:Transcript_23780/g.94291  ORF Transcript_23780/g.94291 Transcript_23780/m.94291 type:complete len:518 (-) Transcript_23780:1248-2801(-)
MTPPRRLADLKARHVTLSVTDDATGETLSVQLPVQRPALGPPVIETSRLYAKTGFLAFDPGFTATASCASAITFIDGPRGQLLHRGYTIDELAEKSSFLEVCYLLLNGELPATRRQLRIFEAEVTRRMTVHEKLRSFLKGFPDGAHPMAIMVGTVGALSAFYCRADVADMDDAARALAAVRVIAKLPMIAAMAYRHSTGQPFVYPRRDLGFAANFYHCCFHSPLDAGAVAAPPAAFARALDAFFLLHADHEQNASTSTVRLAGSSEANPFACIASGIASLWGPRHGGANEAVIRQLRAIGDPANIPKYLERAKDKADPFLLFGFGHRVYRNTDPRAKQMKKLAMECIAERERLDRAEAREGAAYLSSPMGEASLASSTFQDRPAGKELRQLFQLAVELEDAALKDPYFVERKLFPNVDFYSGLALTAIGIPLSLFTCLFAIGRSVGWIAQWKEFMDDPARKIGRPRQVYAGEPPREYPSFEVRERRDSAEKQAALFTGRIARKPSEKGLDDPYGFFF